MKHQHLILRAATITGLASFAATAGIDTYTVETAYQNGKHEIRVLLPDNYQKSKRYKVLYVLPVEVEFQQNFGYGLGILKEMNAHNLHDLIIVQMGFEKEPWFGDHAVDPKTRQASYVKEYVVPFIESHYATLEKPEGRLLFGFSKSGWGAFSLILTYPDCFGYAAAWDAPITFKEFRFGMEGVYGTPAQLALYRPDLLIPKRKKTFQDKTRLVLSGSNSSHQTCWGSYTLETHQLLDKEGVKHLFDNSQDATHSWNKQWMLPTLEALMRLTRQPAGSNPQREPDARDGVSAVHTP